MSESIREVYPNAPLVLVALELRHPTVAEVSGAAQVKIKQAFSRQLPLLRTANLTTVQGTFGAQPEIKTEIAPKYMSRDRTTAVTYRTEAIVIETTRYQRYEWLADIARIAVEARQQTTPVDGIERIGLRYINEIRVPEIAGVDEWGEWVDPLLLGPLPKGSALGLSASQFQGVAAFGNGPDRELVLRYGPRDGYAVDPAGDLRRSAPAPGPFFLIDIDSYWMPSVEVPEAELDQILTVCSDLHRPLQVLFESLISSRLRVEVMRNA